MRDAEGGVPYEKRKQNKLIRNPAYVISFSQTFFLQFSYTSMNFNGIISIRESFTKTKRRHEQMRFLTLLRRINRGVALGILLVIGLAVYLTADDMAFAKERDAIKQVLEEYTKDMSAAHLLPEEYLEIGAVVPETVVENKIEENRELLGKYIPARTSGENYTQSPMLDQFEQMLRLNRESGSKVKSYEASLTRIRNISKYGSNMVTVEADISISVSYTQGAFMVNFLRMSNYSFNDYGYGTAMPYFGGSETIAIGDSVEKAEELSYMSQQIDTTFTFDMIKRNGVWIFSDDGTLRTSSISYSTIRY